MASPNTDAVCLICRDAIFFKNDDYSCVGHKGLTSINEFTHKHNELFPENPIPIYQFDANVKQYVHKSCRKSHTNSRRYEQIGKRQHADETGPTSHKLRSDTKQFSFHTDCYLCGVHVDQEKARKYPNNAEFEFSHVMLLSVSENILQRCNKRRETHPDSWADAVTQRLACSSDLPAEEAIYHRRCLHYFMSPRNLTLDMVPTNKDGAPPRKRGRPSGTLNEMKQSSFFHVLEYLENNDDETVTLDELYEVMESHATKEEVYSKKSLQRQLYAHYGDRVSIMSTKQ